MASFKNEFFPFGFDKRKVATFFIQRDTDRLNKMDEKMKADCVKFIASSEEHFKAWRKEMLKHCK